jgi:hypothetical protein
MDRRLPKVWCGTSFVHIAVRTILSASLEQKETLNNPLIVDRPPQRSTLTSLFFLMEGTGVLCANAESPLAAQLRTFLQK